jgi:hypothetical protein
MIINYITQTELENLYPQLYTSFKEANIDFSKYIERGFTRLTNDLYNRGIDLKMLMPTLDLLRSATAEGGDPLTLKTIASDYTGETFEGGNELRLVLWNSAVSGTWAVKLQGCNQATPTDWEDVTTFNVDSTGELSATFLRQYVWYRVVITGGTSLTFRCWMVETTFDDLICYAAWENLFANHSNSETDIIETRRSGAEKKYLELLQNQKFSLDDGDYNADTKDSQAKIEVRFSR